MRNSLLGNDISSNGNNFVRAVSQAGYILYGIASIKIVKSNTAKIKLLYIKKIIINHNSLTRIIL